MKKITILITVILAVILAGLLYIYYISPKLMPNIQDTGSQKTENILFDTNDNLNQGIDDLNALESL